MSAPETAPYGSWRSPITSDSIVCAMIRLDAIALDGENVYWSESRPDRQGRYFLVCRTPDGKIYDVLPDDAELNVRTRVHEYGGGAFAIGNGEVYLSNYADQRLYRQLPGGRPEPVTATSVPAGALRYADAILDSSRDRLICIQEDHTGDGEAVNRLVAIKLRSGALGTVTTLVSGNDFYSSPKLSPDGTQLAWLTWNHPNMPWDETELWRAEIGLDGILENAIRVAGGEGESVFQPEWSPEGVLYYVSDRVSGWWNLYREGETQSFYPMEAEFGRPQWGFGMSTYKFIGSGQIFCAYTQGGVWQLAKIDTLTGLLENIHTPYTEISQLRANNNVVVFVGGSPSDPNSIVRLDLLSRKLEVLRRSTSTREELDALAGYLSTPEQVAFSTDGGRTAYGLYYRPRNADFVAQAGERQPLLVKAHGGPTGAASSTLSLTVQYWTSRGIAVLDVNYGGSSGYGRAYRKRLEGEFGNVDVQDCRNGALYLAERGDVDVDRMAISGGSAGGYTVLRALTPDDGKPTFRSGASHYGISDLEALARDTHKFESRYLDGLVGPYPAAKQVYIDRSPIHHVDRLTVPVIFFQGAEDEVVPPSQTESMVNALRSSGVTVGYLLFAGEQHGFRRSENIKRALDAELYFYATELIKCDLRF